MGKLISLLTTQVIVIYGNDSAAPTSVIPDHIQ